VGHGRGVSDTMRFERACETVVDWLDSLCRRAHSGQFVETLPPPPSQSHGQGQAQDQGQRPVRCVRATCPASTVPMLPFSRVRAEGGVHDGHGLELAGRQELFGGHDRRETGARDGPPNRSGHRQRAPDWATLHAREAHARLTYAGGGSSVTRGLGPWVTLSRNPCVPESAGLLPLPGARPPDRLGLEKLFPTWAKAGALATP